MNLPEDMLYLTSACVEEACHAMDSVQLMRDVLSLHAAGRTVLPDEAYLAWTTPNGDRVRSLSMPGYVCAKAAQAGVKIINSNPQNVTRGLPRASGLTVLFDPETTRVRCIMEGATISALRTASVTAAAAQALTGNPIDSVGIIGAGVLAREHIMLLGRTLPECRRIRLFDVETARATTLCKAVWPVLARLGIDVEIVGCAEAAIRGADLVVPATTTTTGYIRYEWLRKGVVLVNVSLDDPEPEVILRADRLFVDDWRLVSNDPHRLLGRLWRDGLLVGPLETTTRPNVRKVDGELGAVISGACPGRLTNDDVVVVNPFGLAIEDVTLAHAVYQWALSKQIGQWLAR